jgi:hypothetical protein
MILNILTINKIERFIAHKKNKGHNGLSDSDESDDEEEIMHEYAEKNITNVFLEALKMSKMQSKVMNDTHERLINDKENLDSNQSETKKQSNSANASKMDNSQEPSLNYLTHNHKIKTDRTVHNFKSAKIIPTDKNIEAERLDSKSSMKNSVKDSQGALVEIKIDSKISSVEIVKKDPIHFDNKTIRRNIFTKFANVNKSKNYTGLNELKPGDFFGEIS